MINSESNRSKLITVVPVFNGELYIGRTLDSIKRQTLLPDRIIVQDNCSTDRTERITREFGRCEWRKNEHNLGLFGNLNRALEYAGETEYLHILHADDLLMPGFYESCLAAGSSMEGRGLIFCPSLLIDAEDKPLASQPKLHEVAETTSMSPRQMLADLSELKPFYFPGVLMKTSVAPAPCQFRLDLPQLADMVFWAEWVSHSSGIVRINKRLSANRIHSQSGTHQNLNNLQSWVLDEWIAMRAILSIAGLTGIDRILKTHKLRCVFAARSIVKMRQVRAANPSFAHAIQKESRKVAGPIHWLLARLAVAAFR